MPELRELSHPSAAVGGGILRLMWLPECAGAGCTLAHQRMDADTGFAAGSALSHERYVILTQTVTVLCQNQNLSNQYHSMLVRSLIDNNGAENKSRWYSYFTIPGFSFL